MERIRALVARKAHKISDLTAEDLSMGEAIVVYRIDGGNLYDPELLHLGDEIEGMEVGYGVNALVISEGELSMRNSIIRGEPLIDL